MPRRALLMLETPTFDQMIELMRFQLRTDQPSASLTAHGLVRSPTAPLERDRQEGRREGR